MGPRPDRLGALRTDTRAPSTSPGSTPSSTACAPGIQPWFNLGYGNRLYIKEANGEFAVGWIPLYNEEAKTAWIRFVEKLADHFRDRVTHWELWNEPNIPNFWQPTKPNGADYVRFVEMTAPLIRKRVPKSFLIGGGVSGLAFGYLEDALQAGLAARRRGVVSSLPADAGSQLCRRGARAPRAAAAAQAVARAVARRERAPSDPNSSGALSQFAWTEAAQAEVAGAPSGHRSGKSASTSPPFPHRRPGEPVALKATGKTNFKGVLRGTDYTPKPSYAALQHVCRLFDAETKPRGLRPQLADPRAFGLMGATFERKGRPLCVYWNPAALPDGAQPSKWICRCGPARPRRSSGPCSSTSCPAPSMTRRPKPGAMATFAKLPLTDAPIVLTDRSVVAIRNWNEA